MSKKPWFENEGFWNTVRPFMFAPDREEEARSQVDCVSALLELKPGAW